MLELKLDKIENIKKQINYKITDCDDFIKIFCKYITVYEKIKFKLSLTECFVKKKIKKYKKKIDELNEIENYLKKIIKTFITRENLYLILDKIDKIVKADNKDLCEVEYKLFYIAETILEKYQNEEFKKELLQYLLQKQIKFNKNVCFCQFFGIKDTEFLLNIVKKYKITGDSINSLKEDLEIIDDDEKIIKLLIGISSNFSIIKVEDIPEKIINNKMFLDNILNNNIKVIAAVMLKKLNIDNKIYFIKNYKKIYIMKKVIFLI